VRRECDVLRADPAPFFIATRTLSHLATDVGLLSGLSRLVAALRPSFAGLAVLTEPSTQPGLALRDGWECIRSVASIRDASRIMSSQSPIAPFVQPPGRPSDDVSGTPAPVTEAERVVIRMLARRAARKWLAELARAATSPESDPR
jgi:hypothetical protein